ncbi:MAG TPA: YggS family pyridoxal phosphate-dependent enzyme [Tenuifilaceae bacterium]|nr:YggS family pyridoxal phosphate-dependent enzyme [Tenuifilaceae bacterium]HPI43963.1 YggS family pyridoxal phosphate-dependent enzyme [Tenuifilaceae bacterium]
MSIQTNIQEIKSSLPPHVTLVAVSKTHPVEVIMEAYNAGHRIFGENKVQELVSKYEGMPKDIEWHLIGHLQSNKVKYIAAFVSLIHSVDSIKLLEVIDKEAQKHNRVIDCLLQIHIASEETKFGLSADELEELLSSNDFKEMKNIRVVGLMGMATFTDNMAQVRMEFKFLNNLFKSVKEKYFADKPWFKELSMGMSSDYAVAVEEGSTMVRIGSNIFGHRNYKSN